MIILTPVVFSVLYACVLYICICTCSAQLSMFHTERRCRNTHYYYYHYYYAAAADDDDDYYYTVTG